MKFLPKIPAAVGAAYTRTLLIVLLNLPLVWGCLLWDLRGVDVTALTAAYAAAVLAGWYVLPLLVVLGAVFLLLLPVRRAAAPATALIMAVYVYYLLLDAVAYGVIRIHIDFFWLEYLVRDFAGLGLPTSSVVTAGVALVLVLLAEFGILRLSGRLRPPRRLAPLVWAAAVLAMTASQILHIVAYQRNDSRVTVLTPHLPFYVPFTSHRNADKYGDLLPFAMDENAAVLEESTASLTYPLAPLTFDPAAAPSPPNLVVILLESWRFDAMDADVTPNIHRFSLESSVFTQNLSTGNQTTAGIFGIFYGLHPTYWAAVKANSARIDNPVLIDAMTDRGYACALYARSKFGRHKIQDTMFRDIALHEDFAGKNVPEMDVDLTEGFLGFLREQAARGGPFFGLAFYKSSHYDYCYPPEYEIDKPAKNINMAFMNAGTDPAPYLNDYRNAVRYTDMMVGRVLDELRALDLFDKTIVIVTTDHGEAFNDDRANFWGHGTNYTKYEVQVPLIIRFPDREPAVYTHRTSLADIPPTLLTRYFGCTSDPRDYANGRDLFDAAAPPRAHVVSSYVNHAFVFGDDVHEILPLSTRKYRFDDAKSEGGDPPPELLRSVMEEINRFYR